MNIELQNRIDKQLIDPRIFLNDLIFDETAKNGVIYNDPRFLPFYLHLGRLIKPKNVLVWNLGDGVTTSFFLKYCDSVEKVITIDSEDTYIGNSNIRFNFDGQIETYVMNLNQFITNNVLNFELDLIFINREMLYDQYMLFLEFVWSFLRKKGLIVLDYINRDQVKEAYSDFCKVKNKDQCLVNTRYTVGLIEKD